MRTNNSPQKPTCISGLYFDQTLDIDKYLESVIIYKTFAPQLLFERRRVVSGKSRRKFLCIDCRIDTGKIGEFYFIETGTWLSVMSTIKGMLCVGCIEARLGRKLVPDDFTSATVNSPKYGVKSLRLMSRLAA